MRTKKILKIILVILLLGYYLYNSVFLILTSKDPKKYTGGDFGVFYAAAKMLKEKVPLYDENASKYIRKIKKVPENIITGTRYLYPPRLCLLFSLLHFLA